MVNGGVAAGVYLAENKFGGLIGEWFTRQLGVPISNGQVLAVIIGMLFLSIFVAAVILGPHPEGP